MAEEPLPPIGKRLSLGVIGLGRAFTLMLPTFRRHPRFRLGAACDPRPNARARFTEEFDAPAFAAFEDLCAQPDLDAVYIASPHQFHAEQARHAAHSGKHILVEKPMALSLQDCEAMIAAAREAGVRLVVGHSHSFDAPIARAASLIASGTYGRLKMITALNFTDFLYRPRRPEEFNAQFGGGVVFNQAPHQVDILRLLGGGRLASVRACAGRWDEARPTEGAYSALFTFEGGACASLTYSGYAHFDSDELCGWVSELGETKDEHAYGGSRRALMRSEPSEAELKDARAYGGGERNLVSSPEPAGHQHFGFFVASCEGADLRPTPGGVVIYGNQAREFHACPRPDLPRREVLDELFDAVTANRDAPHSGEWALATMEASLGILTSSREGREIALSRQCEFRNG